MATRNDSKVVVGIDNYKTGTKNNWRRQCWNEIASRIKNKKDAVGLYLAAEQDLDRAVAVSKGFNPNNLIAVDMRRSVVESLRSQGKAAIHGPIDEVLSSYKTPLDFIHADFCCGITKSVESVIDLALFKGRLKKDGVLLVNLQRGRESGVWAESTKHLGSGLSDKRRGVIAWVKIVLAFSSAYGRVAGTESISDQSIINCIHTLEGAFRPVVFSYKSSAAKGLYFDTLVVTSALSANKVLDDDLTDFGTKEMRQQIAAINAVRTMRTNGRLSSSPRW